MVLGALLAAACTVQEGDTPPRNTQGEFAVCSEVMAWNGRVASEVVYVACGLGEYFRQSTDEGREAVRKRYFDGAQVTDLGAERWSLEGSGRRYLFELAGGIPLGEAGASWSFSLSAGADGEPEMTGALATDGDRVRCSCVRRTTDRTESAEWLTRIVAEERSLRMSFEGSGRIELAVEERNREREEWLVEYRTQSPIVQQAEAWTPSEGSLAVTARLDGPELRRMAFRAEHLGTGCVRISDGTRSEEWYW